LINNGSLSCLDLSRNFKKQKKLQTNPGLRSRLFGGHGFIPDQLMLMSRQST